MSTQTAPSIAVRKHVAADRRFYLAMALASTALITYGFSRSYYLKLHYPTSPVLSPLVHLHGAVYTAWMLYFVLQTALISLKRPALHRKLGLTGAVLGSAMIALGLAVTFSAVRLHHGSPTQDAEVIFLVGLLDLITFALFFILGYRYRRDREAHQRLMLLAVVAGLVGPALGRIVGFGVPVPAIALLDLGFLFAGPLYDLLTRRRIHPVYIYGCLFALATFPPLRFALGATPWWHRMAHLIAGM